MWKYVQKSCINEFNGAAAITSTDVKHDVVSTVTYGTVVGTRHENQFHKFAAQQ